jgi:hypothetical protein
LHWVTAMQHITTREKQQHFSSLSCWRRTIGREKPDKMVLFASKPVNFRQNITSLLEKFKLENELCSW